MIYVQFADGGVASFLGMTLEVVAQMMDERGVSYSIITEQEFLDVANRPMG